MPDRPLAAEGSGAERPLAGAVPQGSTGQAGASRPLSESLQSVGTLTSKIARQGDSALSLCPCPPLKEDQISTSSTKRGNSSYARSFQNLGFFVSIGLTMAWILA